MSQLCLSLQSLREHQACSRTRSLCPGTWHLAFGPPGRYCCSPMASGPARADRQQGGLLSCGTDVTTFAAFLSILLEKYRINYKQVCSGGKGASFIRLLCAQLGCSDAYGDANALEDLKPVVCSSPSSHPCMPKQLPNFPLSLQETLGLGRNQGEKKVSAAPSACYCKLRPWGHAGNRHHCPGPCPHR